jgi:hypothetical protein
MPIDTRGLRQEHVGKQLRVELAGGEVDEITLLELTICEPPEPCCGITYRLQSSNRSDGAKKLNEVYWTAFGEIENFRALGTMSPPEERGT